ncbi:MAG: hypothetical protein LKK51_06690 [Eubacterium sp.]|jgi:hypothetical protein|nr:hypothetical protein [Eubacterium sp.]MCI2197729.1 hypothetical protein [Eubacterium sp.]
MTRKSNHYLPITGALCIVSLAMLFSLRGPLNQSIANFQPDKLLVLLYGFLTKPLFVFCLSTVIAIAILKRRNYQIKTAAARVIRIILYAALAAYLLIIISWLGGLFAGTTAYITPFKVIDSGIPFIAAGVLSAALSASGKRSEV